VEKGVDLLYQIDENIAPVLQGDPVRLYQILMNLVSNAVKFTSTGYVRVDCELKGASDNECQIEIRVVDTGVGMKDTRIIFEAFEQESNTVFRKFGGSGLGLAICKELVDLYKGTISVESQLGRGSVFKVTLPFKIGRENEFMEDVMPMELEQSSLAGKKILLADDNGVNQYVIKSILIDWKINVSVVINGEEAIKKIRTENFDLVLMDIKMPVINGLEATQHIRREIGSKIPIIALTANSLPVEIEKTKEVGMDDFVSKPVDPTILYSKILKHLGIDTNLHTMQGDEPLYSLSTIRELARGSDEFVSTTIELFLDKTPPIVDAIKRGLQANDLREIKNQVHKLKSTASLFKMNKVLELIDKLENIESEIDEAELNLTIARLEASISQVQALLRDKQERQ
jgi:CheY-like chemotaxis protein/anti-sigma regulatory factor (Ser/Thr protein kinase)